MNLLQTKGCHGIFNSIFAFAKKESLFKNRFRKIIHCVSTPVRIHHSKRVLFYIVIVFTCLELHRGIQSHSDHHQNVFVNSWTYKLPNLPPSVRLPSNLDVKDLPTSCENSSTSFNRFGRPCIKYRGAYTYTVRIHNPNFTYVFCTPPRCTSALHRAIGLRVMALGNWDRQPTRNENWPSFRFKADEFAPLLLNESIPRFIVVRNPMARAISAFIRTFHYNNSDQTELPMYFEQWVLKTIRWASSEHNQIEPIRWKEYKYPKSHFIPQTMFCGFTVRDVWRYFTIFKMEDRKAIANYMCSFMPSKYLYGWGAFNESLYNLLMDDEQIHRRPNLTGDLLSYLSFHKKQSDSRLAMFYRNRDIFDRVATAYAHDIYFLNYSGDVKSLRVSIFGNETRDHV